jgi:uncharacterized protein (DUF1697 family)
MIYVSLLRGINVGGNTKVPMADLKKTLNELGFTDVKTLLNSGNVVFESQGKNIHAIKDKVEQNLKQRFGFPITVIIRTAEELKLLVEDDPFKNIVVSPRTRLYVSFLSDISNSSLKIPYKSAENTLEIVRATSSEVCSVIVISEKLGTIDLMKFMEKEFGKNITTRNWNTVKKITTI